MPTIVIPRKTIKKADLVLVPRREYEDLVRARKELTKKMAVKRSPSFMVPKRHEKYYNKLDKQLTDSLRDYYQGSYYGPFKTADEAVRSLRRRRQ